MSIEIVQIPKNVRQYGAYNEIYKALESVGLKKAIKIRLADFPKLRPAYCGAALQWPRRHPDETLRQKFNTPEGVAYLWRVKRKNGNGHA